jgi:hypothetical protein
MARRMARRMEVQRRKGECYDHFYVVPTCVYKVYEFTHVKLSRIISCNFSTVYALCMDLLHEYKDAKK